MRSPRLKNHKKFHRNKINFEMKRMEIKFPLNNFYFVIKKDFPFTESSQ
jgi:hypothetical protein